MARQKNDGKGRLGGRVKGTPNKATTDLKTWVASILDDGREQFQKDLENLEPSERVRVYVGLLNYVLPKQSAITPKIEDESTSYNGLTIIVDDKETADLVKRLKDK